MKKFKLEPKTPLSGILGVKKNLKSQEEIPKNNKTEEFLYKNQAPNTKLKNFPKNSTNNSISVF